MASEFNEYQQRNALDWKPQVGNTFLAYEAQDALGKNRDFQPRPQFSSTVDVTGVSKDETPRFYRDEKGYYYYLTSGADEFKHHYFDANQTVLQLYPYNEQGQLVKGAWYDLNAERKRVDQAIGQKGQQVEQQAPQQYRPNQGYLDVPSAYGQERQPLGADRVRQPAASDMIESLDANTNGLGMLSYLDRLAVKAGPLLDEQIDLLDNRFKNSSSRSLFVNPVDRLKMADYLLARAWRNARQPGADGEVVLNLDENSTFGRDLDKAIDQLNIVVQGSNTQIPRDRPLPSAATSMGFAAPEELDMYQRWGGVNTQALIRLSTLNWIRDNLNKRVMPDGTSQPSTLQYLLNGRKLKDLLP